MIRNANNRRLLQNELLRCHRALAGTVNPLFSDGFSGSQSSATTPTVLTSTTRGGKVSRRWLSHGGFGSRRRHVQNKIGLNSNNNIDNHHRRRSLPFSPSASPLPGNGQALRAFSDRCFENESEYHTIADETLEDIQDAVEIAIEDNDVGADAAGDDEEEPEVVFASGVLTMGFPPHGTWVLNKQTPNRQIWWSSPISGPRRYEYDGETWVYTRSGGEDGSSEDADGAATTLTGAIVDEFRQIYGIELDL
mmetsp:Transcript_17107/g.35135  ORF Transcript_17107/g.35135 Transcript_17107/m.35135 type:complete len:250 (+) Transcript_17107:247-996(+)|eukprot:CAMPEP_0201162426 /NCGR_PEP_ID=MMETSP0851-20130426/51817_1 /ASSEMBLY_ACC=CAM_ASM_000631 /TAXON_ID=183588 /ORGANISM="Pseudo-nitzschia fraudulenta, Strain WWA7" /LENGTH=249 /DNA_ID=CAMNT_0047442233 /DNA_START=248 /DNA_END=997 /DNA_ORIENTATION=-